MFGSDDNGRRSHFVGMASKVLKGINREQCVPGAIVTISPNLATGDRSDLETIWEVLAFNGGAVVLKAVGGDMRDWRDRTKVRATIVQWHEHEFYAAEQMLEVIPHG